MSVTELDPEGLNPGMVAEIASMLEREAGIDYISLSAPFYGLERFPGRR